MAALGYEMVLGNTFHLFIQPGHEHIERMGGLHEFMGWNGAIITDSGGFQVFSMGHGSIAEEVKRRAPERREASHGGVIAIEEEGVRFRSYLDGARAVHGPETSMEIQAALGSDVALAFDECTPFHVDRDYTARSTERTHRWLDRCVAWHERNAPDWQLFFGIVQGGVHEDLRRESARARDAGGDRRRRDRRVARPGQGRDARGRRPDRCRCCRTRCRATCSESATSTTSCTGSGRESTCSTARRPPASPATAPRWSPTRTRAGGSTSSKAVHADSREPIAAGCPCPACRATRGATSTTWSARGS